MDEYWDPRAIKPRRFSVFTADDDRSAIVVVEAQDEDHALQRALRIAPELGISVNDSGLWQAIPCDEAISSYSPQYAAEYFDLLDSRRARRQGELH